MFVSLCQFVLRTKVLFDATNKFQYFLSYPCIFPFLDSENPISLFRLIQPLPWSLSFALEWSTSTLILMNFRLLLSNSTVYLARILWFSFLFTENRPDIQLKLPINRSNFDIGCDQGYASERSPEDEVPPLFPPFRAASYHSMHNRRPQWDYDTRNACDYSFITPGKLIKSLK